MNEIPKCDFHIHTKYLECANGSMEIEAIVRECDRAGVTSLGITDHLNSLDKLDLHVLIKDDIAGLDTDVSVYFGVELNFMKADGPFAYSRDVIDQYGFQFAVGGIHTTYLDDYDIDKLVDIQHRHHIKACEDPLLDVLVHPYWFNKGEFNKNDWPWFDSMRAVSASHARELGQVAKATDTAIEINANAILTNPVYDSRFVGEYLDYLALIAEEGACFSLGSDAHDIGALHNITAAWQAASRLGLGPERIWRPEGKPMQASGRKPGIA